jgi:hypothetical protein
MREILTIAGLLERENIFVFKTRSYCPYVQYSFAIQQRRKRLVPATVGRIAPSNMLVIIQTQFFRVNNIQVVQKQVGFGLHNCWKDSVGIC